MKPDFDIFSFVNLFGALNGVLFAVIFLKIERGNRNANRFAALLLLVMGVIAAGSFFSTSGYFRIYPKLQKIFSPFLFLMGPLLFFYVRSLLFGDSDFRKKRVFHMFPALLNVLGYVPFYLKSDAEKVAMLALGITPFVRAIRVLTLIQFSIYLLIIQRDIRRYRSLAGEQYSFDSRMKVQWIVYLGLAFGTILLVNAVPDIPIPGLMDLGKVWEALLIIVLGYLGLTRPVLLLNKDTRSEPDKAGQPLIPEIRQGEYAARIEKFMSGEKPYLDPELSMRVFAERVRIPENYCSFVINRRWKMNFFHFVNRYRIEEFKRLLEDPGRSESILETALAVGFNSKSTFNAVFKRNEGMTPSQYLRARGPRKRPI